MQVLIIGSGGREHALAWKVAQSPRLTQLFVAPGNAGTASIAQNVPISAEDSATLVAFAREKKIDLGIVGPEVPLANGVSDVLRDAGIRVFGPSRAAAQLEASKTFAKAFMARHQIPTARYAAFGEYDAALRFLHTVDYPIVIKASGLAAGKGVIIPESMPEAENALRQIMLKREFGAAGDQVVIEERWQGEEVSLLAFTDGITVKPMLPAQDHKRLLDNDCGPNTGGMGAYAPAPICPPAMVTELTRTILQPTVDAMRAEGTPFVGALYAGLMLTHDGVRVLEYNCRFGDPETQVILPLLDSDLIAIAEACATQRLNQVDVKWKSGAAACVVAASGGYPGAYQNEKEIFGLGPARSDCAVFHAGTKIVNGKVVTAGGRVLAVSGWETDSRTDTETDKRTHADMISRALEKAYAVIGKIHFEGMQYRKDIGRRAVTSIE
ncbi:MAG: phosphoribosylamine--glycine ligase [Chloroflexi bacterium]|nr:phosphoribosylamine--glycine ligase [Chloroflexota bacterium]